jgi:glycosyltransferase involved in cell wall biosynthesis
MRSCLIYSPNLDGHRQVYALVMATVLHELGFKINIACNTKQIINNTFYVEKIKEIPDVSFIDLSKYNSGGYGISFEEFVKLQSEHKIDLTIFAEADPHISLFCSKIFQKRLQFRGRLVGVFMRPFYIYRYHSLLSILRFLKHFPSRWRKDERFFYDFILKQFSIFDALLSIDENFVSHHKHFTWLPDIFQQYADLIAPDENKGQQQWIDKLTDFINVNSNRFHFFYFGTAAARRGYDTLLNLAQEYDGCFIHYGLKGENQKYIYNTDQIKNVLQDTGRLFETNEYIIDPLTIKHFFKSSNLMLFPYRKFYGSSGVMLQALGYGVPVLSPDFGIMGQRVKKYSLGITYDEMNVNDMKSQFELFRNQNPKSYEINIKNYMSFQTIDQLKSTLINSFTGSKLPVVSPL